MSETVGQPPAAMPLRYAGKCRTCAATLSAGTMAVYDRTSKTVTCTACIGSAAPVEIQPSHYSAQEDSSAGAMMATEPEEPEIFAGVAGASAREEGKRRSDKREARIREAHPKLGGLMLALSEDPQSTRAWNVDARGEEVLGRRLDKLKGETIHLLHDRGIPGTKANIDHIVVCPSGVFVIDAKRYKGKPSLRVEGGLFRERTETLVVGTRDCTKLVAGVHKQVNLVLAALAKRGLQHVPVTGMLCFVEAEWPLLGGDFVIEKIKVLWPSKAADLIRKPGLLDAATSQQVFRSLAEAFPVA